ncbi:MAG: branched-chain amino acid transport system permease protein [Acidobacteriota bacterium]|jgi:branched-chain amino acid transport system permease protein|nr:branched-chain amino acid transport system permease protein [Acidobacteriota bacterium]
MPPFIKRILGALVIVAVLVAINMAMSSEGLFGFGLPYYYSHLLRLAGINIILAVSLNLITGFTGQFSIGHAGFMAIGAYSSVYLTVYYTQGLEEKLAGAIGAGAAGALVFLLVVLAGALAAAIAGLIVGIPSLRLRGDYLAIVTLGFAEIIRIMLVNIKQVGGPTGFSGALPPFAGRATIPPYANFLWIGAFAVLTIVVVYNIVRSNVGRTLISIREDELAAQAMGINATRYKVLAFVISSAFAGIAGALFGHYNQFLSTQDFQFIRSFEVIIMIVLGGMGSITGSLLGAVVITVLPELLRTYPYDIVFLLVLIPLTVLLLRAIGRNRLPSFLREGARYYGFVLALYAALFVIARLVLINVLDVDYRLQSVIGDISKYRLVIYSALLIGMMLTRPQGLLGGREFGLSWLKRAQKRPEGDEAVGASKGVAIAERDAPTADPAKEVENR